VSSNGLIPFIFMVASTPMTKELLLKKHRNVSRIDLEYGKTHGWFVRKEGPGKGMSKFFSDRMHGGRYSSLKSALDWRDKISQFDFKFRPGSVSLKLLVLVVSVLCWSHIAGATEFRPIVLDPSYEHDKWQTLPRVTRCSIFCSPYNFIRWSR
jgi:hypothetical protein